MTNPLWQFDNAETGETITRELTDEEIAAMPVDTDLPNPE